MTNDPEPPVAPVVQEKADMFDWSAGGALSTKMDDDEFKIEFSDSSDEDSDEDIFSKKETMDVTIVEDYEATVDNNTTPQKEDTQAKLDQSDRLVDMFAQQIKFLSCLKILIQEMSTLATGFEVIGGQLRYFLFV